jgi:UDP:flavonoid glycosyltransferase YjiC (YdhE family)
MRPEPPLVVHEFPTPSDEFPDGPVVLVTFGTNFNKDAAVWSAILDSLADIPFLVAAATGPGYDLASELGALPANTVARQFVPLRTLLARSSVVVTHGGAGTTLGALAFGKPLLLLPQAADQRYIASFVERAGAGELLRPKDAGDQVRAILEDDGMRRGAQRIQHEIAAMPAAGHVAGLLEDVPARR